MKSKYFPYLAILIFAVLVRFVWLDKVPSSLYYDEIDLGYQIRSYFQTGKDYRGELTPFFARSFNTDKTPVPIWFSAIISIFFGSPEYQVRAGTALAGTLVVILAMLISFQITKSKIASFFTGAVFAFSPWLIHFSRLAFEAQFALLFLFLFWAVINHWVDSKSQIAFWLSAVILGLSVYTYRTMSFLAPTLAVAVIAVYYKNYLLVGIRRTLLWVLLVFIVIVPFIYSTTIGSKDQARITQISIFSDPEIPIQIQRSRELESGDYQNGGYGRQATLLSKIFHNKPLVYVQSFVSNALNNYSPAFLFTEGDPNGRHSAKKSGELLVIDCISLLIGSYFVFRNISKRKFILLFTLLLFGAVPSNLTLDGANHASRLITFAGPLLMVVSFGYFYFYQIASESRVGKIILLFTLLLWIFFQAQFLNKYFLTFPIQNAREFGYGYKQAIEKITPLSSQFAHVALTEFNDPPILYYLFWANIPPKSVQDYGVNFGQEVVRGLPLDKIKTFRKKAPLCSIEGIKSLSPDTLYMVAFMDLPIDLRPGKDSTPVGIKVLDMVQYPNNEPAYYLITRDTVKNKAVEPLLNQKCK